MIHDSGFGLFVFFADSHSDADSFRAECGRAGETTSVPVRLPQGIDWGALELVLSFLDQICALPAVPGSTDRSAIARDVVAAFTALGPYLDHIIEMIPQLLTRDLPELCDRAVTVGSATTATSRPRVIVNGGDLRLQQAHESIVEFRHPLGAGLIGIRPSRAGKLVIEVYSTTGAVAARHDQPRPHRQRRAEADTPTPN